jgi:hypothetical protein
MARRYTAHLSPRCTPRRRAGEIQQLNARAQITSRKKKEENVDGFHVCYTWTSPSLFIGKRAALS